MWSSVTNDCGAFVLYLSDTIEVVTFVCLNTYVNFLAVAGVTLCKTLMLPICDKW